MPTLAHTCIHTPCPPQSTLAPLTPCTICVHAPLFTSPLAPSTTPPGLSMPTLTLRVAPFAPSAPVFAPHAPLSPHWQPLHPRPPHHPCSHPHHSHLILEHKCQASLVLSHIVAVLRISDLWTKWKTRVINQVGSNCRVQEVGVWVHFVDVCSGGTACLVCWLCEFEI